MPSEILRWHSPLRCLEQFATTFDGFLRFLTREPFWPLMVPLTTGGAHETELLKKKG